MSEEKILRTSILGGFKRTDVLNYVEYLKCEIETLKDEISRKLHEIDNLNTSVNSITEQYEKVKEFEQKFSQKADEVVTLNAKNEALTTEISELKAKNDEYEKTQADIIKTREALKVTESQLGAAFLDARKYSEEIVTAANSKASDVSKLASSEISAQAAEISRLSSDVDRIALTFTKSIDELHSNISELAKKLANAAVSLTERDGAVFLPDVSIKIESNSNTEKPQESDFNEVPNLVYRFEQKKEG